MRPRLRGWFLRRRPHRESSEDLLRASTRPRVQVSITIVLIGIEVQVVCGLQLSEDAGHLPTHIAVQVVDQPSLRSDGVAIVIMQRWASATAARPALDRWAVKPGRSRQCDRRRQIPASADVDRDESGHAEHRYEITSRGSGGTGAPHRMPAVGWSNASRLPPITRSKVSGEPWSKVTSTPCWSSSS